MDIVNSNVYAGFIANNISSGIKPDCTCPQAPWQILWTCWLGYPALSYSYAAFLNWSLYAGLSSILVCPQKINLASYVSQFSKISICSSFMASRFWNHSIMTFIWMAYAIAGVCVTTMNIVKPTPSSCKYSCFIAPLL